MTSYTSKIAGMAGIVALCLSPTFTEAMEPLKNVQKGPVMEEPQLPPCLHQMIGTVPMPMYQGTYTQDSGLVKAADEAPQNKIDIPLCYDAVA